MRLQEPDYQSPTGYEEYEYPEEILRTFLNRVRQGTAWRTRPNLMQQMVNDLDQALSRCREDGEAHRVGDPPIEIKAAPVFSAPLTCTDCGRQFKLKAHLVKHQKSHVLVSA